MIDDSPETELDSPPSKDKAVKLSVSKPTNTRFKVTAPKPNPRQVDGECREYEVEIIGVKDEPEDNLANVVNPCDVPITLSAEELTDNITQLLSLLVDEQTLGELGWPDVACETVLADVIAQCGQTPADRTTCPDYETVMRENAKLLFTSVISNDSIKSLLNNHSVDEVILHVLKLAS